MIAIALESLLGIIKGVWQLMASVLILILIVAAIVCFAALISKLNKVIDKVIK